VVSGLADKEFAAMFQSNFAFFLMVQEVEQHTRKLREKFGMFEHAPFRTHFDPSREREQLHMLLPSYDDEGGQPSSKRSKLLGGGYTVRTYQRSQQSNREAQVCSHICVNCSESVLSFE
jgi:hypothetical protein